VEDGARRVAVKVRHARSDAAQELTLCAELANDLRSGEESHGMVKGGCGEGSWERAVGGLVGVSRRNSDLRRLVVEQRAQASRCELHQQ
jgi:hypothetical protein